MNDLPISEYTGEPYNPDWGYQFYPQKKQKEKSQVSHEDRAEDKSPDSGLWDRFVGKIKRGNE